MTHQNHQTNGASLEDCHTNFFSLTELYGIKWRKLVWGDTSSGGGGGGAEGEGAAPLADPVISSYARCLAGDILCVWRRVPTHQPQDIYDTGPPQLVPPPLSLRAAKELWIFWYGEEPDLNGLVAPELIASQGEQGSWEGGLSYECRSLLFKALHNLIERCLLSRDFVRLGKWFVQPYDGDEEDVAKSPWHLSFSFAFFLHGESTVCASVDVRQHPPVRTLTPKRLARLARLARTARSDEQTNKVILAPFGLEGSVTGREWSDADPATGRLLDAWRQLYPLEQACGALEVICGGVRMRYPAPYVLTAGQEATSPSAPALPNAPSAPNAPTAPTAPPAATAPAVAAPLAERTIRALTLNNPHQTAELCNGETGDRGDDFVDPTRKTPCTCAKWRRRRAARPAPFHRRAAPAPRVHRHATNTAGGTVCSPGSCGGGSPAAPASAPSSAGAQPASPPTHNPPHRTPQHQQGGACVPTTLHTPAPTPDPLAPPTPAPPTKLFNQNESPRPEGGEGGESGEGCVAGGMVPARPVLPLPEARPDPLEDETSLHMLYDYTTVNAWLEHPVKRFKPSENVFVEEMALGSAPHDLYAGHQHTSMAACKPPSRERNDQQDDLKEYKNLFTSDGLCPTLKDLDQIFDNSDDASGDEAVRLLQVQTPPDSNKSMEETRLPLHGGGLPTELSKMFPTPPSLEAHAQPSPGFTLPDEDRPRPVPQASPPPDPIEDWSYVFKPPTVCKYVGSSKYAPLAALPSQLLPPVPLPPSAVYRPRRPPEPKRPHRDKNSAGTKRSPGSVAPTAAPSRAGSPRWAAPPPPSPRVPPAAACPLLLNVLLADTVLNVFRDHNFDSCTVCVCHDGPNMVGNIRGADAATYLCGSGAVGNTGGDSPDSPPPPTAHELDHYIKCSCGFSAILNRRLAHRAGLFYEDEMEITGLAEEPSGGVTPSASMSEVVELVTAQCAALPGGGACALARAASNAANASAAQTPDRIDLLEYSDGGAAAALALRAAGGGRTAASGTGAVHRWPFMSACGPMSSRDVVGLMWRLRPLLQDAIQKRCCGARMWDGVSGPLTWRQFHRLAGRGNEDLCEPQPVPPLLVGHDSDWLSLSPYALRHWERLSLEPYSHSRDVAYLVIAPDAPALHDPLKAFFKELSAAYEACRLGRHRPVTRIARDGIVRAAPSLSTGPDEWVGETPPGKLGRYVRAYAEALRARLVPQLAAMPLERAFDEPTRTTQPPLDEAATATEPEPEPAQLGGGSWAREEGGAPALVVYVVEPPAAAARRGAALHALLRLASKTQRALPHLNPLVKIVSLEGVCAAWGLGGGSGAGGGARALALSVFTGCRRLLQHTPNGKSLTGFGTAADANLFISSKDEKNRAPYKLFTPAWVVGGGGAGRLRGGDAADGWAGAAQGQVLFLAYCLSHDQRWLLAAVSDARGELLDTAAINVHVPPRSRRRRGAPARRLGLTKLMDFTLGVMSQAAQPWRLVVGRIGRIGHGELKGWSWLLSRKNLVRASSQLRAACGSCNSLYPHGAPCILSACLVSTEPDSRLRLMADRFTPDERFSQHTIHSHLHTPRDVTATHILVFPTSATTTSTQTQFEQPAAGDENDMFDLDIEMPDEEMEDDNLLFLKDSFLSSVMWGAPGSPPPMDRADDDAVGEDDVPGRAHRPNDASFARADDHGAEAIGNVLQQPLALGYLVSTAPLGAMPSWWWGGSGHLRGACPAFLKNALHLHSLAAGDDLAVSLAQAHHTHPLDSQLTTDVLRYVLEGYNALSWLALDGATHDRLSCLPLHVQALLQLYHTAAALG